MYWAFVPNRISKGQEVSVPGAMQLAIDMSRLRKAAALLAIQWYSRDAGTTTRGVPASDSLAVRGSGAEVITEILEAHYRDATRVRLVMDNLDTHADRSIDQAFPPERARQLYEPLKIHYTQKHKSWLDMVEIELSILMGQCLNRRIMTDAEMSRQIAA
jgi:hypothetical protein